MKTKTLKLLGCAVLSGLFAFVSQAQSVSSTPVGYVTYTVNANSDLKLGIPMEQSSSFTGSVSSVTSGVIDAGSATGDLTSNAHYIKITSGTLSGNWYQVTAASGNTVTVAEDLSALGLAADDTFQAIPFWTLDTLFSNGGGVPSSNDPFNPSALVFTFDPSASGINIATSTSHFYYPDGDPGNFGIPAGWFNASTFSSSGGEVFNPDTFLQVRNQTGVSTDLVITGTVPSSGVSLPIVSTSSAAQDNLVYNPYPASVTLSTSNLSESGAVSGSNDPFNPSDLVLVFDSSATGYNPASSSSYFYYPEGDPGNFGIPSGWFNASTFEDANDVVIEKGAPIIIRKGVASDEVVSWTSELPYSL
jgi:uncharacterized protein (TIGR02597 family)